ncbi:MAG: hypothetical protein JST54_22420 [Deltaproteobacteria bacterium]|nr:hypothetical protein [Deltaproteobacteria bacterium]
MFTGTLTLAGTMMHVQHVEACPDLGPICDTQPQAPYQHDQHLVSTDLALDGELGLAPHLAFELVATLRQVTDRIRYLDLAGNPYTPPVPDFHHRNETLVGPADPWLMLHAGTALERWTLSAKAGVTLPIGSTVPNPFELGRVGLPHEHIQFGTGTFDPVAGLSLSRAFDGFGIGVWTLDRFTFATNPYSYRSGHKLLAGANATSMLGLASWSFQGGLDIYRETPERWSGVIEDEGNVGRTDLILDLNATWSFSRRFALVMGAKVPVVSHVQGEQAGYPAILDVGLSGTFGASAEK